MPEDEPSWRRFKSTSYEELGDWGFAWFVVFAVLGVIAYSAVTSKAVPYSTGALLLVLGGLVRRRGGSDP